MEDPGGIAHAGGSYRWPRTEVAVAWAGRALIALGLALRARQYATNRSLWLDEAFLAGAILGRPWRMLLADLPNVQVAPIGFIAMERFLVALLGPAEWVLRLVPFVAGCAALPMTRALASRAIGPVAALAPLAIVATSRAAVYYSSEFKAVLDRPVRLHGPRPARGAPARPTGATGRLRRALSRRDARPLVLAPEPLRARRHRPRARGGRPRPARRFARAATGPARGSLSRELRAAVSHLALARCRGR